MRDMKPIFVENSKVPVFLSKLAPININAITLFFVVFSRGEISERTKRHETIHFQQYLETLVVGFILIYLVDFLVRLFLYKFDGKRAYRMICFEQEAHDWDDLQDYLARRKRFSWLKYLLKK